MEAKTTTASPTMREMISQKISSFEAHHQGLKARKGGFLVAPATILLGWVVLVVGLITIPLPGPGWLTVFIGVAIISLEQKWARGVLGFGVKAYDGFFAWYHRQNRTTRYAVISAGVAVVWVTFMALFYGAWSMGWANFADPAMYAMGLHR
ncbi:TIGR02611 family protein [Corynebacterium lubricantis]|uniref:TIGR02611 family protein n=1 Tax=Corynebacterium lubricantis TaxID=541095 RepID=UPI0003A63876|nr:TIGR02611 family protein [Corynebacterium lubricantis]